MAICVRPNESSKPNTRRRRFSSPFLLLACVFIDAVHTYTFCFSLCSPSSPLVDNDVDDDDDAEQCERMKNIIFQVVRRCRRRGGRRRSSERASGEKEEKGKKTR